MSKEKRKARANARRKAQAQSTTDAANAPKDMTPVNIIVVGERKTLSFSLRRHDISDAGRSLPFKKYGTDRLVTEMGLSLNDSTFVSTVDSDQSRKKQFCAMVATYVSRTASFELMQVSNSNTVIFSIFKTNESGGYQTRIAGLVHLTNVDDQFIQAARSAIVGNAMYFDDIYAPSSRYFSL